MLSLPRNFQIRSPAWCYSPPRHRNPVRPSQPTISPTASSVASPRCCPVAHIGAGHLVAQLSFGTLPPRARDEARANSSTAPHLGSYIEEFLEGSASVHQAASLTDLGGKPLSVHAADRNADDEWQSQQDRLATLSTNSLHRHTDATHASLLEDEADSAAASQAIHDVVAAVRTSQPLPPR
jgi:hypothetical protein